MMEQRVPVFNIERFAIHDGPGIRTTVFFQGCPLRCAWCANPESQTVGRKLMFLEKKCTGCGRCAQKCPRRAISLKEGKAYIDRNLCIRCGSCEETCPNEAMSISGKEMKLSEIYQIIIRDLDYYVQSGGGLTLSGGEALLHIDAVMPLLEKCREDGIHISVETCGNIPEKNIEAALAIVDLFLFDIKSLNEEKLAKYTGGNLSLILNNFSRIAKADPNKIVVRVPVIPGVNNTEKELLEIFSFAAEHGVNRINLLPYHTLGITKYNQLGMVYPFGCTESMRKETLMPFQEKGKKMGLEVAVF